MDGFVDIGSQQVEMIETMVSAPGIDFYDFLIWPLKIHVIFISKLSEGGVNLCPLFLSPAKFRRAVDACPSDMPETGVEMRFRRGRDLC